MPIQNNAQRIREETAWIKANQEREEREKVAKEARDENERHLKVVQGNSQKLEQLQQKRELADAQLEHLETKNLRYKNLGMLEVVGHGLFTASVAGVYVIDNFLLGDTAREIAKGYVKSLKTMVSNPDWIILLAIILIPLAYIGLELAAGYSFGIERQAGKVSFATYTFAILAWLTLPIVIIGFSLSNSGLLDPNKTVGNATLFATITRIAGQGLVAIVSHGFILWNSERIIEGIGYFAFKLRHFLNAAN